MILIVLFICHIQLFFFQTPLGVLDKDETKIADMVDILEEYHKYVPGDEAGEPFMIPLFGDQLSVERSYDAQKARINAEDAWGQLQGLHPSIQEWHKRGILLQVFFRYALLGYNSVAVKFLPSLYRLRWCN